jgi:hypothetical protein
MWKTTYTHIYHLLVAIIIIFFVCSALSKRKKNTILYKNLVSGTKQIYVYVRVVFFFFFFIFFSLARIKTCRDIYDVCLWYVFFLIDDMKVKICHYVNKGEGKEKRPLNVYVFTIKVNVRWVRMLFDLVNVRYRMHIYLCEFTERSKSIWSFFSSSPLTLSFYSSAVSLLIDLKIPSKRFSRKLHFDASVDQLNPYSLQKDYFLFDSHWEFIFNHVKIFVAHIVWWWSFLIILSDMYRDFILCFILLNLFIFKLIVYKHNHLDQVLFSS